MLEKLREGSQGVVAKVILGLVILSFALAGVGSYMTTSSTPLAAEVNGEEITRAEYENAYQNERSRREAQLGDGFNQLAADPTYMAQLRQSVLDQIVNERLLNQAVERFGLRASDEQVKQAIRATGAFQTDGVFDNEHYLNALSRARLSPTQYSEMVREDLNRRQLQLSLLGSEFALTSEAEVLAKLERQTRDLRYVEVPVSQFVNADLPSAEAQQAYYDANAVQFQTEEALDIEYLVVDTASLASTITVEASAAEEYYQQNIARYSQPEQRRVAHILFSVAEGEDAAQQQAEQVLAEIQSGGDFATLAKQYSIDTFSGENGGELGWIDRGVQAESFDQATFSLEEGGVSDVISTQHGLHIIKLLEIQEQQVLPFSEVQEQVIAKLQLQQAADAFYAKAQQLSEVSFEIPDSLDEVATETGLALQTVDKFTRSQAQGDLAEMAVLQQLFNPEFIAEGLNSEAINIGDDKTIVVRVNGHYPATAKTFDDVQDTVVLILQEQQAVDAAQAYSDELLIALQSGEAEALLASQGFSLSEEQTVTRNSRDLDPQVLRHVFSMAKEGGVDQVISSNGNHVVLELLSVQDFAELAPAETQRWIEQLDSMNAYSSYQLLVDVLKSQADISYLL